jgi:putative membrane protein
MPRRSLAFALVALLAPALAPADARAPDAGEPPPGGTTDRGGVLSDAEIVGILHTANLGELATGKQAQAQGESPAVRDFGARMVAEHSALDEQLLALARQLGVSPAASKVSEWLQGTADHIRTATEPYSGASYDVLYIDGQLYLHATVAGLTDWLATEAEAPELRAAIDAARPKILDHLQSATSIRNALGNPPVPLQK